MLHLFDANDEDTALECHPACCHLGSRMVSVSLLLVDVVIVDVENEVDVEKFTLAHRNDVNFRKWGCCRFPLC